MNLNPEMAMEKSPRLARWLTGNRSSPMPIASNASIKGIIGVAFCFASTLCVCADFRTPDFQQDILPLLETYCFECHGDKKIKGGVNFVEMTTEAKAQLHYKDWENAIQALHAGEMPPDAAEQPKASEVDLLKRWYQEVLVEQVIAKPALFQSRRLSAGEYRHTLTSLLGFDPEVAIMEAEQTQSETSLVLKLLPDDPPGESGFQNDTHKQPLTSGLWDQYAYITDSALNQLQDRGSPIWQKTLQYPWKNPEEAIKHITPLFQSFQRRAYRRPVPLDDSEHLASTIARASNPVAALKKELRVILMSPPFLYRGLLMDVTRDKPVLVDDFELAERLSYFLWQDMPDERLFQLAEQGLLHRKTILEKQIQRMLKDIKSRRLSEGFTTQWLGLGAMDSFARKQLPLAVSLKTQPIEFVHYLIHENRPLLELIDSRITFTNPHLAKHYAEDRKQIASYRKARGIELENIAHTRIELRHTPHRGGILTMPGILAMNRGPILRGNWILERILGDHLPDPPANIGQVQPNSQGKHLSFRERFSLHRANPSCAFCHDKIDPLGFALQDYNDQGGYQPWAKLPGKGKDRLTRTPIDTSGKLPSGETFENLIQLKKLLITVKGDQIIHHLTEQLMSYALCRKLEIWDQPSVRRISQAMHEEQAGWADLISEIAMSLPFTQTIVTSVKPE